MSKLAILILTVLVISCTDQADQANKITSSVNDLSENYSTEKAHLIAKNYSLAYLPDSMPYEGIGKLNNVPDSVVQAFKILRRADSAAHNKWLTVIFLKLSLDHLRCCRHHFEVRNKPGLDSISDPLLYEYLITTKVFDVTKRIEFINSGRLPELWLERNPSLRFDPEIQNILNEMKPIEDSISKGLYLKE